MNIKPLPGNMIVKLESFYQDTGLIKVPERYRKTPHIVGRIIRVNVREIDTRTLGYEIFPGQRIIISHLGGRFLSDDQWIYPITTRRRDVRGYKYQDSIIIAIIPDTVNLAPHTQAVERCQFCGEARIGAKQNTILVDGVCPRCGKMPNGEQKDNSVTVSDSEVEEFYETQLRAAAS